MSSGYKLAGPAESPYIPSSDSNRSGSPTDHPGEFLREKTPPVQPVAYNPTFAGQYVNSYGEAHTTSSSRGVSDVDFDDKTGTAYASLNEFQDRRAAAAAAKMNSTHAQGNDFASVPNKSAGDGSVRCLMITIFVLIIVLFLIALAGLGLSMYNFLNTYENGSLLPQGTVPPPSGTTDPLTSGGPSVAELTALVEELQTNLSQLTNTHNGRYNEIGDRFDQLTVAVENASTVALSSIPGQLPLYDNCSRQIASSCTVDTMLNNAALPSFSNCETPPAPVDSPSFRTLDIYCSVVSENGDAVTSTLNIFDGEATCYCTLLALHAPLPESGIFCRLNILRCPNLFNLTSPDLI